MAHWKDGLGLPPDAAERVPSSYDLVGDIAILRLDTDLAEHEPEIGRAMLDGVPPAKVVAVDRGVEGRFRARELDIIAGEDRTTTEEREHGLRLRLDLSTCYFSPRLSGERERVADLVEPGEHVLDPFAGVGPFALLCAKRGASVVAADLNPAAVAYLDENTRLNKLGASVQVLHGDARLVARACPGWADRIVMNLPHNAVDFLEAAVVACAPEATIHLGAMVNRYEQEEFEAALPDAANGRPIETVNVREVRGYNPAVRHYVYDLRVA